MTKKNKDKKPVVAPKPTEIKKEEHETRFGVLPPGSGCCPGSSAGFYPATDPDNGN